MQHIAHKNVDNTLARQQDRDNNDQRAPTAMKVGSKLLLALCVFYPSIGGITAFFVQAPNARTFKGNSHLSSYLDSLTGSSSSADTPRTGSAAKAPVYNTPTPITTTAYPSLSSAGQDMDQAMQLAANKARELPWTQENTSEQAATQTAESYPDIFTQSAQIEEEVDSFADSGERATIYSSAEAAQVNDASADQTAAKSIWETALPVIIQGSSLKTCSFSAESVRFVQVALKTEGRPLDATVDLWQGPDNMPAKMRVFIEDGYVRPLSAVIATPRGQNSIAIRNTGQLEFPLTACVQADVGHGCEAVINSLSDTTRPETVQGGSLKTFSFNPSVASVQILLKTDGRPLNARIELLQGPNNNKQIIELYTEDGLERPFFAVIETPGAGNVVRVVNTGPLEFPMTARVAPYLVEGEDSDAPSGGWDTDAFAGGWGSKHF